MDMNRPVCKTCPYWDMIDKSEGYCLRFPPVLTRSVKPFDNDVDVNWHGFWDQPKTLNDSSCGEHPLFPAYIESLKPLSLGPSSSENE